MPSLRIAALFLAATLVAGCGGGHDSSAVAFTVARADEALSRVRDDAAKHAPQELAGVEEQMRFVKGSITLRRYREAADRMPRLNADLERLIEITRERKGRADAATRVATQQWNAIADEVPRLIARVQERIDAITKSGKRPAGLSRAQFDALKARFETVRQTWAQADDAVTRSNAVEAAAKAQEAKAASQELLKQLGA